MITHTISMLELSWTIIGLIGLCFMIALFHRTYVDYQIAVEYNGQHRIRQYAAKTSLLIFIGGCITQLSYVVVGIVAMTQPSVHHRVSVANYITGSSFILSSAISVVFAAVIYRRRVKIVQMLEKDR